MGRCLYLREGCLFPGDDSAEVLESLRQNRDFRRRFFRQSRPKKRENAQRMHIKHSLGMRTVLRRGFRFCLRLSSRRRCPGKQASLPEAQAVPQRGLSLRPPCHSTPNPLLSQRPPPLPSSDCFSSRSAQSHGESRSVPSYHIRQPP